jgi:D-alanyl-D-alanine-carboxypeptidase/D-alanyl-D-alanine-endopeptidase
MASQRSPVRARLAPYSSAMSADDLAEHVERVLDKRAKKYVGLAVGVRHRNATYTTGRGLVADDRPYPPDERTIFEIGSITKVFTATLLADLAQEGLLAHDDPVEPYLPDGVTMPRRGRPITLADLATHTSGLPRLPKGLLRVAIRESSNPYASFDPNRFWAAVPLTRPRREPGKKLRYSNYGAGLLGNVLALRAGKSYEELVEERICRPLGLVDTAIAIPAEKRDRLAQPHNRRRRAVPHWDLPSLPGAGALRSTVADLLVFLGAQLGEAPEPLATSIRTTHDPRARRGKLEIGLGWFRLPLRGAPNRVLWHDGGTGGSFSVAGFVPELVLAAVVFTNTARPVDRIGLEIVESIVAQRAVDNRRSRSSY